MLAMLARHIEFLVLRFDAGIGEAAAAEGAKAAGEAAGAAGAFDAAGSAGLESAFGIGTGIDTGGALISDAGLAATEGGLAGLPGTIPTQAATQGPILEGAVEGGMGLVDAVTNTPPGLSNVVKNALDPEQARSFSSSIKPGISAPSPISGGSSFGMSDVKDFLKDNKSLILPGVGMAASLMNQPKMPQIPNLENIAQSLQSGGTAAARDAATSLIPSVSTGNLPAGAQASVQNALQDATQSIKSKYASMGMSGSTAEAQELSAAQARSEALKFDMTKQLTQTGLEAAGVSNSGDMSAANLYALIMNEQLQTDQQLSEALSRFALAGSLGGGLKI